MEKGREGWREGKQNGALILTSLSIRLITRVPHTLLSRFLSFAFNKTTVLVHRTALQALGVLSSPVVNCLFVYINVARGGREKLRTGTVAYTVTTGTRAANARIHDSHTYSQYTHVWA